MSGAAQFMTFHPLMWILAGAFLLAPVALAVAADVQVRAFQKEAFGHLAKAARWLRLMGWIILVYYGGVLIGSYALDELQDLVRWPLSTAGLVIYVRVGAAVLGYALLNLVARELYRVVRPGGKQGKARSAPSSD